MNKVYLLFAIHSHQPVGNFEHVFAQAVRDSYAPFVDILEAHPKVRLSLHYSGPLLEWLEAHEPGVLEKLRGLVARGQVELLGGGFYEPLLSYIPQRDAHGQLAMMNDYCQRRLGQRPRGFWLTERVWDPALPLRLAGCGLRYTVVDDTHLLYAGLSEEGVRGYYVTERDGKMLAVFPTHKRLRYLIPFRQVAETMEFLRAKAAESPGIALTYGDDGEKFGVWPGTRQWVFEEGWLERFMAAVEEAPWLEMLPLGDYLERFPPTGRIYLPTASYEEMTEWALPVEAQLRYQDMLAELEREGRREQWRPFIRAGIWDNFLVKYSEANLMHKRMLWTSNRVHALGERPEATRELYRGQCNCAYWHGLFGGLYLKHLRQAVFHHLILAERLAEEGRPAGWAEAEECDYDRDGRQEVVVTNAELFACLAPACGGGLFELDYKPAAANLTDTLTRRREAYHRALVAAAHNHEKSGANGEPLSIHERVAVKETGLEKLLIYDTYQRRSFLDHFLSEAADIEALRGGGPVEEGDFLEAPYRLLGHEVQEGIVTVRLEREGTLTRNGQAQAVRLAKTYRVSPAPGAAVEVSYELSAPEALSCRFGVELNLSPVGEDDPEVYALVEGKRYPAGETLAVEGIEGFTLTEQRQGYRVELTARPAATLWSWPLETVSQSDEGFERNRQGTVVLFSWPLTLSPGRPQRLTLTLRPAKT